MYARGMSAVQFSEQIRDVYGFEVREGMVTAITNRLLPEIKAWQKRPLSAVYPIVFIDAIVFNVRENNVIRKAAACVILGINEEGRKEADKDKTAFANDLKTIYHASDEQTALAHLDEVRAALE